MLEALDALPPIHDRINRSKSLLRTVSGRTCNRNNIP